MGKSKIKPTPASISFEKIPEGKQKAYVWLISEDPGKEKDTLLATLWICDAPLPEERLILYTEDGKFKYYEVKYRIYGANALHRTGVWNLYVKEDNIL
jgi:hypothetical protein